eukprot:Gregarina_sp_Pseudo_9__902@NODE_157_length_3934_cov_34_019769_g144_i0_p3_GENE_NODE_157_length_3934_cov_34_019769_g144_i0NODE_157_length_3934_cov_34_019769_g144_i0_p3_ORF_typecomplete_len293_score35_95_NODE_157_length_3934_cov_34_019769_g144_i082960
MVVRAVVITEAVEQIAFESWDEAAVLAPCLACLTWKFDLHNDEFVKTFGTEQVYGWLADLQQEWNSKNCLLQRRAQELQDSSNEVLCPESYGDGAAVGDGDLGTFRDKITLPDGLVEDESCLDSFSQDSWCDPPSILSLLPFFLAYKFLVPKKYRENYEIVKGFENKLIPLILELIRKRNAVTEEPSRAPAADFPIEVFQYKSQTWLGRMKAWHRKPVSQLIGLTGSEAQLSEKDVGRISWRLKTCTDFPPEALFAYVCGIKTDVKPIVTQHRSLCPSRASQRSEGRVFDII